MTEKIFKAKKPVRKGPRTRATLRVCVSLEEKEQIETLASSVNKPVSVLLRELALGYRPATVIDQRTYLKLIETKGLLGRLGGLLKWYLSPENEQPYDVQLVRNNLEATTVLREHLNDVADEILRKIRLAS